MLGLLILPKFLFGSRKHKLFRKTSHLSSNRWRWSLDRRRSPPSLARCSSLLAFRSHLCPCPWTHDLFLHCCTRSHTAPLLCLGDNANAAGGGKSTPGSVLGACNPGSPQPRLTPHRLQLRQYFKNAGSSPRRDHKIPNTPRWRGCARFAFCGQLESPQHAVVATGA